MQGLSTRTRTTKSYGRTEHGLLTPQPVDHYGTRKGPRTTEKSWVTSHSFFGSQNPRRLSVDVGCLPRHWLRLPGSSTFHLSRPPPTLARHSEDVHLLHYSLHAEDAHVPRHHRRTERRGKARVVHPTTNHDSVRISLLPQVLKPCLDLPESNLGRDIGPVSCAAPTLGDDMTPYKSGALFADTTHPSTQDTCTPSETGLSRPPRSHPLPLTL